MAETVAQIKRVGKGKKYDCIAGVSGGRDSTYTLYTAVKHGLRPLAVHFDNGWDSEVAVTNIKNSCAALDVDLHTVVADWDEFKDLQIAFLKASIPEAEIPTDVAIHGALHQVAVQEGVRYVVLGHSFRTEGIAPIEWTYMDGRYINAVQRKFGNLKPRSVPNMTLSKFLYYGFVRRIQVVPILNYVPYLHADVQKILESEVGWTYYGGHHHESVYTHFFQSYLLPRKFNIDKRKLEYSALIRSGQRARDECLKEIEETSYPFDDERVDYCIKKLNLTRDEFDRIMDTPPKSFRDYPTYYPLITALRIPIRMAYRLGVCSPILYFKYLSWDRYRR